MGARANQTLLNRVDKFIAKTVKTPSVDYRMSEQSPRKLTRAGGQEGSSASTSR